MIGSERNLTIHEIEDGEEFSAWLGELLDNHPSTRLVDLSIEQRHLALANEIGDWIGGVRYTLRGGVATLMEIGVVPAERGRGHALRLLTAFQAHAEADGAHLAEFWTSTLQTEPLLSALGWKLRLTRDGYWNGARWYLFEREFDPLSP